MEGSFIFYNCILESRHCLNLMVETQGMSLGQDCEHCLRMFLTTGLTLNPFAEEFVPSGHKCSSLNPNATIFIPKSLRPLDRMSSTSDSFSPKICSKDTKSPTMAKENQLSNKLPQTSSFLKTKDPNQVVKRPSLIHQFFCNGSEESDNDDEDDDEWDSISQTSLDDSEGEEFFHPLQSFAFLIDISPRIQSEKNCSTFDQYPQKFSKNEIRQRIREANKDWMENYKKSDKLKEKAPSFKRVDFSAPETWTYLDEEPSLADDLKNSRISDLPQRKADQARMEKLLSPILEKSHREKILLRNSKCTNQSMT